MKNRFLLIGLAVCLTGVSACSSSTESGGSAQSFHQDLLVFDGHNDVLYTSVMKGLDIGQRLESGHTDLPRLREGGVDVQVFAVWSDHTGNFGTANQQIDGLVHLLENYPGEIELARDHGDIQRIREAGKIAAVIGVEGGHMIESRLDYLDSLYARGARYMTLTWNNSPDWATSATDETRRIDTLSHKGLTDFGRQVVRRMNELGMLVDLSHVGRQTFYDVMAIVDKPVLVSHSNAYTLMPHPRNLHDDQIEAVRENGGVIGVNFYSGFIDPGQAQKIHDAYCKYVGDDAEAFTTDELYAKLPEAGRQEVRPPFAMLLDHIDYLVKHAGIDHVALGSDFDGIDASPQELDDVRDFPKITQALLDRGYSKEDIRKIMGENLIRLMKANGI